jgi:DoxX-like family
MSAEAVSTGVSKKALWAGRTISTVIVLLLVLDGVMKFFKPQPVVDAFAHLGIPIELDFAIGTLLLFCTLLYAVPATSILGAILLTGYLGGAVMTHLRAGDPLFTHVLFPTYLGSLIWLGLYLRDPRLRILIPLRN